MTAYLYQNLNANDPGEGEDQELIPQTWISSAVFTIQRPQDPPGITIVLPGTIIADGTATCTVPAPQHDQPGQYVGVCRFAYGTGPSPSNTGKFRAFPIAYNVNDPYEGSGLQPYDPAVDLAWQWFDDLFDAEQGGPNLRDQTMGRFDKSRIRTFAPNVLFDINTTQPQTNDTLQSFNYSTNNGLAIFTQGFVVHTIKHLIRSYAEIPNPTNAAVGWFDRRDYIARWTSIYETENKSYTHNLDYFKRGLLDEGTRALVSIKNGRGIFPGIRTNGIYRGGYGW